MKKKPPGMPQAVRSGLYYFQVMPGTNDKFKEPVPSEAHNTTRKAIIAELAEGPCSARDLSAAVRISEREVSAHLEHIRKSLLSSNRHLMIVPAECKKCGFVFAKRDKFRRPGKCPVCKGESIREPRFVIEEKKG